MSGRYAFSLPDPRQRDGWFRVGSIDVTTTALIVGIGVISMFVYAIDRAFVFQGVFQSTLVREGELWRLVTWPLVAYPSIWEVIGLAVFWMFGHLVEERLGRKPYTVLIVAMTVIPAVLVTLIGATNATTGDWEAATAGVSLLSLTFFTAYALENPTARTIFFNIQLWILAAVFVGINVLSALSVRAWGTLWLLLFVLIVGLFGVRQRGMLDSVLSWVPRFPVLSGPTPSPYGEIGGSRPKRPGRGRAKKGPAATPSGPAVIQGPWGASGGGTTPLEQAELDVLLDRISEGGLDSLSPQERRRLEELSRRLRDS